MTMKGFLLFLIFAVFSTERHIMEQTSHQQLLDLDEDSQEESSSEQQLDSMLLELDKDLEGTLNIFPNESSIEVFRNHKTNEIFWKDPKKLISNEKKNSIETFLQQEGESMSNNLFDFISKWYVLPLEARTFVKELLFAMSEDVEIDKRGQSDETALMLAVRFDAERAVANLIQRGADLEAVEKHGYTALHYAVSGRKSSCEILLKNGANPNAQTSQFGDAEVVKLLLQSGAEKAITDLFSKNALDYSPPKCVNLIRTDEDELIKDQTANLPKDQKCIIL